MRKIATLFGLVSLCLLLSNCTSDHPIQGVWVPADSFERGNTLYNFKADGTLKVHDVTLTIRDSIMSWEVVNDSTFTANDKAYTYKIYDNDSLEFVEQGDYAQHSMVKLRRPEKTKITKSKKDIDEILLSKIWSIQDTSKVYWETHLEYFDNKTMIYRYQWNQDSLYNPNSIDTLDNLHLEAWKVDKYGDYYFLHVYRNSRLGNGGSFSFHQILDVENDSYTISDSRSEKGQYKYISKSYTPATAREKEILGSWKSKNSKDKLYGKFLDQENLQRGYIKLYEGSLQMTVEPKNIQFELDTLTNVCGWQVSKDGRTLILEYQIDEPDRVGVQVKYADIVELSEDQMKLRLFQNVFYARSEKPRVVYVNQIQEFQKNN